MADIKILSEYRKLSEKISKPQHYVQNPEPTLQVLTVLYLLSLSVWFQLFMMHRDKTKLHYIRLHDMYFPISCVRGKIKNLKGPRILKCAKQITMLENLHNPDCSLLEDSFT